MLIPYIADLCLPAIAARRVDARFAPGNETRLAVADEDKRQHVDGLGIELTEGGERHALILAREIAGDGDRRCGQTMRQEDAARRGKLRGSSRRARIIERNDEVAGC